ncbi:alpha/beta-hydrolase [Amniculicola lignicola CBS 123094]|uniref:Carboxylic ester hydrolase n=1 Tax=Amniculicola lignicola CBS 123094 TaxID=1392246 RepID=A0A6A5VWW0_9PLEO|nr:alpha/beta-hydrolase [Amniculicola lignicola CBS 123094]
MALLLTALLGFLAKSAYAANRPTVDTTSGPVTGLVNRTTPNVAQFLGIPFAETPTGSLRFLPPKAKSRVNHIDATRFGHSCPQAEPAAPNVWSVDAPNFVIPANTTGEDCLVVNVWAPSKHSSSKQLLPVIVWIHGGGFQTGGGNIPYHDPSLWIERSQKHIVISINYRLNIFGFPNAAGLKDGERNVGLLDLRLGMEWIKANIVNFGGDPRRINLWGQSAGAIAVDYYNFAYPKDPIAQSYIMNSGSALLPIGSVDPQHTNFTFVASYFGCSGTPEAELACFQKVPFADITSFLKTYNDAGTTPALSFSPVVDERTKFSNYTARALAGDFSKRPAIMGTVVNEGESFLPYDQANGPNITLAQGFTLNFFLCPVVKTVSNRYAESVPTWRYLYAGNFSNISPQKWEGAYHQAELPLIFGTHDITDKRSTKFEYAVSHKMQDYWFAFASDPVKGLPKLGWEKYTPKGEAVLVGQEGVVSQPIKESALEAPCDGQVGKPGAVPPGASPPS